MQAVRLLTTFSIIVLFSNFSVGQEHFHHSGYGSIGNSHGFGNAALMPPQRQRMTASPSTVNKPKPKNEMTTKMFVGLEQFSLEMVYVSVVSYNSS